MKELNPIDSDEIISPLDLIPRICYCCDNPLSFNDYQDRNLGDELLNLMRLWQNPYIELLCCRCYMRLERVQKLINSDGSLQEGNFISKRMTEISGEKTLSILRTIAMHSDGRVKKLMEIVDTLNL